MDHRLRRQLHDIGLRIAHLRKLQGLSQKELGDAAGVTFQQIQKYEKGVNRIAASRLFAIAQKLGVTVDLLITREAQGNPATSSHSMSVVDTPGSAELLLAYRKILNAGPRIDEIAGCEVPGSGLASFSFALSPSHSGTRSRDREKGPKTPPSRALHA